MSDGDLLARTPQYVEAMGGPLPPLRHVHIPRTFEELDAIARARAGEEEEEEIVMQPREGSREGMHPRVGSPAGGQALEEGELLVEDDADVESVWEEWNLNDPDDEMEAPSEEEWEVAGFQ